MVNQMVSSNGLSTECSDQAIWELKIKLSSKGPAQVNILCLAPHQGKLPEDKSVLCLLFGKRFQNSTRTYRGVDRVQGLSLCLILLHLLILKLFLLKTTPNRTHRPALRPPEGLQNWTRVVTAVFGLLAALRRRYIQDAQGGPRRDALRQAVDEAGRGILEEVEVKGKIFLDVGNAMFLINDLFIEN